MRIGHSYKQIELTGSFDVIVIGSGIGGLVTASLLARHAGKRVLVLERHYTAGGFTHSFERPGFDWDVGVHYVGQLLSRTSPLRLLFDHISDQNLKWADLGDPYDAIFFGDDRYDFLKGRDAFQERMVEYFPRERRAIDAYLALTQRASRYSELYFADRALPASLAGLLGPTLRVPVAPLARRTTLSVLRELTDNARLIAVLTGNCGDYGLPPGQSSFLMQALLAEHYRDGAAYPVGGASRIAATIVPAIERAGGAVVTSAEVSEILVEGDRAVGVRLADGNELRAPVVVSNAGLRLTYERLLPEQVARRFNLRLGEGLRPSIGSLVLYLGFEGSATELALPRHNYWIYPGDDHDQNFARFLASRERAPTANVPLPVAFCSFAAARDPQFDQRHPGHATAEVITAADCGWFKPWQHTHWKKRGEDYDELKQAWTERLLAPLLARLPQLRGKIRHAELSTPLSTRHFAAHPEGEIYGLSHTPERFTRQVRAETPIAGLYLTGADVLACGVAASAAAGVVAASVVLRREWRTLLRSRASVPPGYRSKRRTPLQPARAH